MTRSTSNLEDVYLYFDSDGIPVARKLKLVSNDDKKRFVWEHSEDGGDTWEKGRNGHKGLFRTDRGSPVQIITEGEKDAITLWGAGFSTASLPDGAGSTDLSVLDPLLEQEEPVEFIFADRDKAGRAHARRVYDYLKEAHPGIRIVESWFGKDISDQVALGYSADLWVDPVAFVVERLEHRQTDATTWRVLCPAHNDRNPSLDLELHPQGFGYLVKCWAGCEAVEVRKTLEIDLPPRVVEAWRSWHIQASGEPKTTTQESTTEAPELPPVSKFFGKAGLKVQTLRRAVEDLETIAFDAGGHAYRYVEGVWLPDGMAAIERHVGKLLRERLRDAHVRNVALALRASKERRFAKADPRYLNLPNGLLHWSTYKLIPHDPTIDALARIPVKWNAEAECPAIDEWLHQVVPNDAVDLVYEVIGYCLLSSQPLHKAIMLLGSGRNGKSTLIRIIKALLGAANVSAVPPQELDTHRFAAAELHGKLANLIGDVDPSHFKSTSKFKQLTGGDLVMAERKRQDPFTFENYATLIASFNRLPTTSDTTEGFFSRWIVIEFVGYFPDGKAVPNLDAKLTTQAELEGLLVKAVEGLNRLMSRGAFEVPASVNKATKQFRVEADVVATWMSEALKSDPNGTMAKSACLERFNDWARTNNHMGMSSRALYGRMEAAAHEVLGVPLKSVKSNGVRKFKGATWTKPVGGMHLKDSN